MLKKLLAVSISILMILGNISPSYANEENKSFDRVVESTLVDNDLPYRSEKYDISKNDWEEINKELNYNGYLNKIDKYNYKEVNHSKLVPVKVESNDYDKAIIIPVYYENNSSKLFTQIVYIPDQKIIISVASAQLNENNDLNEFFAYNNLQFFREIRYSLPKFVCDMGGAVACATFCGGIGTAFPVFGVACSVICGPAFGYACDGA